MTIETTITVNVDRRAGPEIPDEGHVIAWLVADGGWFEGRNGVKFEVCPAHADPDECGCTGEVSIYFASFVAAG